jgi:hypothetical protein
MQESPFIPVFATPNMEQFIYEPIDWDTLRPGDTICAFEDGEEEPFAIHIVQNKLWNAVNFRITENMRAIADTGYRSYEVLTNGSPYKKVYGDAGLVVYRKRVERSDSNRELQSEERTDSRLR